MRVTCSYSLDTAVLDAAPAKLRAAVGELTVAAAERARQLMLASMDAPKSGRLYERGASVHVASAPGEAPAIDTGFLAASVQAQREGRMSALVTVHAEYAVHLEYGTVAMAPRPFFRVSAGKAAEWFFGEAKKLEAMIR